VALSGVGTLDRFMSGERGDTFRLTIPDVGPLSATVVARTDDVTHIRLDMTDSEAQTFEAFVRRLGSKR